MKTFINHLWFYASGRKSLPLKCPLPACCVYHLHGMRQLSKHSAPRHDAPANGTNCERGHWTSFFILLPSRRRGISCSSTLLFPGTMAPSGLVTASPALGASRQPWGWVSLFHSGAQCMHQKQSSFQPEASLGQSQHLSWQIASLSERCSLAVSIMPLWISQWWYSLVWWLKKNTFNFNDGIFSCLFGPLI